MHEIHLASIDSTNTYAKLHASEFDPTSITCIVADEQTAGRGRFQNQWISPPNENLYMTFYFQLPKKQRHLSALGLVLALSMAKTLLAKNIPVKIKWPNDLQLGGQKFGGVLCETSSQGDRFNVFAGIGVNVNMEMQSLLQIGQPATSLKIETQQTWDLTATRKALQHQFVEDLSRFRKEGFASFHALCERLLAYKGKTVRCFDSQHEWIGVCESLNEDGRLNLRMADGSLHTLSSGELRLRSV